MKTIEERMAAAIKQRRLEVGLSQEAMASLAGVHRTYARSIERGKVTISVDVAERIAKSLDISLSELCKRAEAITRTSR